MINDSSRKCLADLLLMEIRVSFSCIYVNCHLLKAHICMIIIRLLPYII